MEKDSREKTLLVILNLADLEIRIGAVQSKVVRLVQTQLFGVVLGLWEPPWVNEKRLREKEGFWAARTPNRKLTQPRTRPADTD